MSATFVLRMFGALKLEMGSESLTKFQTKRSALILARLAIAKGQNIGRDELAEQLWPDDFLDLTRLRLRQEIRRLRQSVGAFGDHLRTDRQWIEIEPGILTTDVELFDKAFAEGQAAADLTVKVTQLRTAVALLNGPFLAGFQDPWVLATRRDYEEKSRRAWLELADTFQAIGEGDEALKATVTAVRNSPLDIEANASLIRRLAERGQAAVARQAFLDFDAVMFRELGTHAPQSIRTIIREASTEVEEEATASEEGPRTQVVRPLPLFGRADLLRTVELELSRQGACIVLVGPVGIGKTHLIREAVWQFSRQSGIPIRLGGSVESVNDGLYVPDGTLEPEELLASIRLAAEAGWRVLAESRIRLASDEVTEIVVKPLAVPNSTDGLEAILANPSVHLLLSNSIDRDSPSPNERNTQQLGELARSLDGVPAALRAFGSRLKVQTPLHILNSLNDGFAEFANEAQSGSECVLDVVERTVSQLPEPARKLLVSLSLLDGASVDLANKLALPHDAAEVWRDLERRCLITISDGGLRRRYHIPNPYAYVIRELFADDNHQEAVAKTWRALSEWAFANSRLMTGPDQESAFSSVQTELPNLLNGLKWAIEHDQDLAGRLVLGTWRTVCARGNPSIEGEIVLRAAEVGAPYLSKRLAGEVWVGCAILMTIVGRNEDAELLFLKARVAFESENQQSGIAWVNMNYASIVLETDPRRAAEMCKQAADMTSHPVVRDLALTTYAFALAELGEYAEALRVGESVFASRLQSEDLSEQARAHGELADIYRRVGRPEAARPLLVESVKRLRDAGIQDILFSALMNLSEVSVDKDERSQTLEQALAIARRIGSNAMLLQVARAQMLLASQHGTMSELIPAIEETFRFTQKSESTRERQRSLKVLADVMYKVEKPSYGNAIRKTLGEDPAGDVHAGWQALLSSDSHATVCVLAVVMVKEALLS